MASFERHLKQTMTYWAPDGYDMFGNNKFTPPRLIYGRWENKSELIITKTGEERISKARVFGAYCLDIDGYLFLGRSNEADPRKLSQAYEIRQLNEIPDLRNLKTIKVAFL